MKTTELLVCGSCLVLALISTFGGASPAWRPQGRFGKRAHVPVMPRVVETAGGEPMLMQNPGFDDDVYRSIQMERLCADPRNADMPACRGFKTSSSSSLSSGSRLKDLADYLRL